MYRNIFLAACICYCLILSSSATTAPYLVKEFEVPLDHFNYVEEKTFKLRYLINDTGTNEASPIFFYTGNEGDIELFANNTGFMWDLAVQFKAVVVFAEHRFYGKSKPFGPDSFNGTSHFGYLSAEQALADFAHLISYLRGDRQVPVIAFGGSYGGMLAAWMRMKYPHLVTGALASSAPIWQFNKMTPCDIFYKITTSVFKTSLSSNCSDNIKRSWSVLSNFSSTDAGRLQLSKIFNFCQPMKTAADITSFQEYLENVYVNLAMINYPYENNFLAPVPAYPVRNFCLPLKKLQKSDVDLLKDLNSALQVYANWTGTTKCLDYSNAYDDSLDNGGWEIQTCNEMVMPMCKTEDTMFRVEAWNFKDYSDNCYHKYKTHPRQDEILIRFGGKNLDYVSNIIFSNGLLDPWSGGGVLNTRNSKINVIIIPEGAHHIDLRSANPNDPLSVIEARKEETEIIGRWIFDYQKLNNIN